MCSKCHWFKTYLTNRKQKVNIYPQNKKGKFSSSWNTLQSGVPHESTLGPLLFIIYINNLPNTINPNAEREIYADETSVLTIANNLNNLQIKLNSTINCMIRGFSVKGLSLNTEKTKLNLAQTIFKIIYSKLLINIKTMKEATNIKFLELE